MSSSTQSSTAQEHRWNLATIAVLAVLWVTLFLRVKTDWQTNPQYSYGWVVPLLAAWLVWRRSVDRPAPQPGCGILTAGLLAIAGLALLPIRLIQEANPEWRLILWAHAFAVLTICLAVVYRAGGRPWVRHFAMPLSFLLICVPWPSVLEHSAIQSLTRFVAGVTVEVAGLAGIPAVQHGNLIEISRGTVGVEEACSGVRSLQTSLMIGLFAGEAFRCTVLKRGLLLAIGMLFALILNLGRTMFLVWSAAKHGIGKIEARHDLAGMIASVVLFAAMWWLARRWGKPLPTPSAVDAAPAQLWARALPIALLVWVLGTEAATEAWYRAHESDFVATARWAVKWPTNNVAFRDVKISETAQAMLRCDESRGAAWKDEEANQWLAFYLRWEPGKNSAQLARSHTPDICIQATGSKLTGDIGVQKIIVHGLAMPFHQYAFEDQGRPLHVFQCLWDDRVSKKEIAITEDWSQRSRLLAARLGKRHLGQQSLEVAVSGPLTAELARAALERELQTLLEVTPPARELSSVQ